MPPRSRQPGEGQRANSGRELHPALVHVLTAEFQLVDPDNLNGIPDRYIPYSHPDALRASLLDVPPLDPTRNHAVISYQSAGEQQWRHLTVTSAEFTLFARHVPMLAESAIQGVLNSRDKKLQKDTGDETVRARSPEDWAAARRSAMRQVMEKQSGMQQHLDQELLPRIKIIHQFTEMTEYPRLARGTSQSVRRRVDYLRDYVFGDMLEAVGNLREWDNEKRALAVRTLQKRLYLDPDKHRRVINFGALLALADEYYGHKQALVRGRIAEANQYIRKRPDVRADILLTDASRAKENHA